MLNPDNGGLFTPINALEPIVDRYEDQGLTRADVWALSALVASEVALPRAARGEVRFTLRWYGRRTCDDVEARTGSCGTNFLGETAECHATAGPHRNLCHGFDGTTTIREFFVEEFGWDDQQITAIMGAHSVGRMRRESVGNVGQWDLTPNTLDNGYFLELTVAAPSFRMVSIDNSDLDGIDDALQWEGRVDGDGPLITMLNSDVALVRDVDTAESVDCDWEGDNRCSRTTPFSSFVETYVGSTRRFLDDYHDVLFELIDHKNTKGSCDSDICKFE
jgi:hypothetical protein